MVESLGMITHKQVHALTHRHKHKIKCIFLPDKYFIRLNIKEKHSMLSLTVLPLKINILIPSLF